MFALSRVIFLDEPFTKPDHELRFYVRSFVLDHARDTGLLILLVTHEASDADAAGEPVIELFGHFS